VRKVRAYVKYVWSYFCLMYLNDLSAVLVIDIWDTQFYYLSTKNDVESLKIIKMYFLEIKKKRFGLALLKWVVPSHLPFSLLIFKAKLSPFKD
jgi:hypothetical protein